MTVLKNKEIASVRCLSVDLLRAIGLLCIILAHVSPPSVIFQLRNFDVVLMVFLSGVSFSLSWGGKDGRYISYVWGRFKRLIVPTWIFLSIYFIIFYLLGVSYGLGTYVYSYGLIGGIGYVWVIRVYFLMAMIAPFCWSAYKKLGANKYLSLFVLLFVIYEVLYIVVGIPDNTIGWLFKQVVPYVIGYGVAFSFGMCSKQMMNRTVLYITLLLSMIFIILLFVNDFSATQIAKYPPQAYYVLYGMIASFILYMIAEHLQCKVIIENKIVSWISKNSLWIYFWHIIPVSLMSNDIITLKYNNFLTRYIVVVLIALMIVVAQNAVEKYLKNALICLVKR